jgi:hypothetical protein
VVACIIGSGKNGSHCCHEVRIVMSDGVVAYRCSIYICHQRSELFNKCAVVKGGGQVERPLCP